MSRVARSYLDHNAGAPLLSSAREAMLGVLSQVGNASSIHAEGREAKRHVEHSRSVLANAVGADLRRIVFTSGATEAVMHALTPVWRRGREEIEFGHLYVSAIEHPAVLSGGRFPADRVTKLKVTPYGVLDLDDLAQAMARHDTNGGPPMVALMLANNETGVVQPVSQAAAIVHDHGGYLVVDAVQGLGKLDIHLPTLGADAAIFSSHKIGGPQGSGALVLDNPEMAPKPLMCGGGQESHHRAGTENVAAIAGFGAAVAETAGGRNFSGREIRQLRDFIEAGLRTICTKEAGQDVQPVVFGAEAARLDNTTCFAIPGIVAETALISLDLEGIALSSGSACSSGKVRKSHVLAAMGIEDDIASCALRLSLGPANAKEDAVRFLEAMKNIIRWSARARERMAV